MPCEKNMADSIVIDNDAIFLFHPSTPRGTGGCGAGGQPVA